MLPSPDPPHPFTVVDAQLNHTTERKSQPSFERFVSISQVMHTAAIHRSSSSAVCGSADNEGLCGRAEAPGCN